MIARGIYAAMAAMAVTAGHATAGALEQTNQSIPILFEQGGYAELGFTLASPDVRGTDILGTGTGNVGRDYSMGSLGLKLDLTDSISAALVVDQPFGISVAYGPASPVFAGTTGQMDSTAVTALLRYRLDGGWAIHGGLRGQWLDASARLGGLGAGPADGYAVRLDREFGVGYVLGGSYELPDIALRVALTYNSEIRYDATTTETLPAAFGGPAVVTAPISYATPQSLNLDIQSGIAERTLVFGSIRWVDWSAFNLSPATFTAATGEALASYPSDIVTYTLGVGHQVTDSLSLAAAVAYEDERNRAGSPLGPVNGYTSLSVAAIHETERHRLSVGIGHYWLRDADPQAGGAPLGTFRDNRLTAIEVKFGFKF